MQQKYKHIYFDVLNLTPPPVGLEKAIAPLEVPLHLLGLLLLDDPGQLQYKVILDFQEDWFRTSQWAG